MQPRVPARRWRQELLPRVGVWLHEICEEAQASATAPPTDARYGGYHHAARALRTILAPGHPLFLRPLFHMACPFDLSNDPEMDEASDAEDPEQVLRQEAADTRAFIEAMPGYIENRSLLTEVERARMQLEDQSLLRANPFHGS